MPKAYWIGRVDVRDKDRYPEYVKTAQPAFERFGAKFLARGGKQVSVEGQARSRNVVIEFSSLQAAQDCWNSPEYQAARAIREQLADGDIVLVEGFDD